MWDVVISLIMVVVVGCLLEFFWGVLELFIFFLVVNVFVGLLGVLVYFFIYMVFFNLVYLFIVCIYGVLGFLGGVLVVFK